MASNIVNIVNTVIDIYWPEDKAWYRAKLTGFILRRLHRQHLRSVSNHVLGFVYYFTNKPPTYD